MNYAKEAFKDHQIKKIWSDRWLVKNPEGSQFWFEVAILSGGRVIVHGDIETAVFAGFSGGSAEAHLRWVAGMKDSPGYGREKMRLSMGADLGVKYCPSQVEGDIVEFSENFEPLVKRALIKYAREANFGQMTQRDIQEDLYEMSGDFETSHIGRIYSARLTYATHAVAKLVELLYGEGN